MREVRYFWVKEKLEWPDREIGNWEIASVFINLSGKEQWCICGADPWEPYTKANFAVIGEEIHCPCESNQGLSQ